MLRVLMISVGPSDHATSARPEQIALVTTSALYEMVVAGMSREHSDICTALRKCDSVITSLRVYAVSGGGRVISAVVFGLSLGMVAFNIVRCMH